MAMYGTLAHSSYVFEFPSVGPNSCPHSQRYFSLAKHQPFLKRPLLTFPAVQQSVKPEVRMCMCSSLSRALSTTPIVHGKTSA